MGKSVERVVVQSPDTTRSSMIIGVEGTALSRAMSC